MSSKPLSFTGEVDPLLARLVLPVLRLLVLLEFPCPITSLSLPVLLLSLSCMLLVVLLLGLPLLSPTSYSMSPTKFTST
ncbi:hypothetical protein HanXRQr2_Chr13g0599861 [Helianthus annuus]|uniref:Uncharacterized protein n=1 Tax=Helianthus annuus TaxID=4232 RepID=A0A9K3EJE6_HELAN|nr:hypothetical protein HanXRQr2_Chr13g0599861 [Helianthus annuus]